MSKKGSLLFLLGFVVVCIGYMLKLLLGLDFPHMDQILWGLFGACIFLGVFLEREIILDFLTMRTTKNGLNMGLIIFLMTIAFVAINYIAHKNNKKWDITREKLNSLADQTVQILKTLDDEVKIVGFYDGDPQNIRTTFLDVTDKMRFESNKVVVEVVEPRKRPDLKKQYNITASGDIVIAYKGKQKVISSMTFLRPEEAEQTIINQIFSLKQSESKAVYFIKGHGEFSVEPKPGGQLDPESISKLKKYLEDVGYTTRELNLIEVGKVPEDAAVVALIRPKATLVQKEVDALVTYLKSGGNMMVAADPGVNHKIDNLLSRVGIQFLNNYVLTLENQSQSLYINYGTIFPAKKLSGKSVDINTVFLLSSEMNYQPKDGITHEFAIATGKSTVVDKPTENLELTLNDLKQVNMGVLAEGKLEGSSKDFKVLAFGDSDFVNDELIETAPGNRDFALNSIAYLANQQELISIRPKNLNLNPFILTQSFQWIFFIGILFPLPAVLFILSAVLWYKRRHA